jgi:hypothetical protein
VLLPARLAASRSFSMIARPPTHVPDRGATGPSFQLPQSGSRVIERSCRRLAGCSGVGVGQGADGCSGLAEELRAQANRLFGVYGSCGGVSDLSSK